ncbi:MAG: 3-hydroxyacyl-ACP dehydratase FabZ family protein [Pirellulales bacterium]
MRWFWIDRYTEFESGKRATAIKNVTLAEEHLHDHFPGAPMMPNPLVVEGMAQTGGLLVAEHSDFEHRVVLAKLAKATFHFSAVPGDTLTYCMTIESLSKDAAKVSGTSHVGQRLQAEVEMWFAYLPEERAGKSLFDPAAMLAMLKQLGVFEIGRDAEGNPLQVPQYLTDAMAQDAKT